MYNVVIAGVGGQGALLASKMLAWMFMNKGYDVKVSEVHGMAQRGGSVVTYLRAGEKVDSPLIEEHGADYLLAFEKLEALRWSDYLKKDGVLIAATTEIQPAGIYFGNIKYPDNIEEEVNKKKIKTEWLPADEYAMEVGNIKAANMVLLGALAKYMDFTDIEWMEAIEKNLPAKLQELNKKAYALGNKK